MDISFHHPLHKSATLLHRHSTAMENIGARINPHWKETEPYFVEQDDARREADVDQQVEVGQHELPADHLRGAPQLAARGWRVAGRWRLRGGGCGGVGWKESQIGDG